MPPPKTGEQLLRAAQQLAPLIREARAEIEQTRALPLALVSAMQAAGIFQMWLPLGLGGSELSVVDFVRVVEALSYEDGSVGWCASLGAAYSRFAAYLPDTIIVEIFEGTVLAGSLAPTGIGVKVSGGYRVSGQWAWGSGIMHSKWIIVAFLVRVDGEPVVVDGRPEMRLGFVAKSSNVRVIDTWTAAGMRGTGSHDFAMDDVFIGDDYTLGGLDPPPRYPGSLYAISLNSIYPFAIAATLLGIASAAFDAFIALAAIKAPVSGSVLLADKPVVQSMVGQSYALLQSARALYYTTARSLPMWAASNLPLTPGQRAQVRLAVAQVGKTSKKVVRDLHDAAGGSSVYEKCPLERHFRDVHAAAQHVQVSPNNFEFAGRVLLGLDPGTARF